MRHYTRHDLGTSGSSVGSMTLVTSPAIDGEAAKLNDPAQLIGIMLIMIVIGLLLDQLRRDCNVVGSVTLESNERFKAGLSDRELLRCTPNRHMIERDRERCTTQQPCVVPNIGITRH